MGNRHRAWENGPSKLPGYSVSHGGGIRGLQGHRGWLNIGTLGDGRGSCQQQGVHPVPSPRGGARMLGNQGGWVSKCHIVLG